MDNRHSYQATEITNPEGEAIAESELPDLSPSADNSSSPASNKKPRSSRKKFPKSPLGGMILSVLLIGGAAGGWYWWQSQPQTAQPTQGRGGGSNQGVSVRVASVELTTLEQSSEIVGNLEAEEAVSIQSEVDGRLIEIYVRPGDRISPGMTIARLDSREAEIQLRQGQANLISAQARLAELQAGPRIEEIAQARARLSQSTARLAELEAGSRAEDIAQARARLRQAEARLQALSGGGSRSQEIAQAEAQIADAEARLDLSAQRVRRNEELLNEGAISRDRFDEVVAENRRAEAALEEAKQRLEELKETKNEDREAAEAAVVEATQALAREERGPRVETIAAAEAEVEERSQELRRLENGTRPEEIAAAEAEVAEVQAQIRALEVGIEDTRVIAPFSGIVGDVPVKIGDYLSRGSVLTTLTQNDTLDLRILISIDRLPELRLGMPVEIYNSNNESLAQGRISFISPQVNTESQTVLAKATFDNSKGQLLDGQFVRAKIIWSRRPGAIVVPATAVVFQGDERFMYLVEQSPPEAEGEEPLLKAKKQPVKLGFVEGDRIEILEGLEPGDQIITSGLQRLSDGATIRVMR
jgi:RND family efflux transporter MFP subunit